MTWADEPCFLTGSWDLDLSPLHHTPTPPPQASGNFRKEARKMGRRLHQASHLLILLHCFLALEPAYWLLGPQSRPGWGVCPNIRRKKQCQFPGTCTTQSRPPSTGSPLHLGKAAVAISRWPDSASMASSGPGSGRWKSLGANKNPVPQR